MWTAVCDGTNDKPSDLSASTLPLHYPEIWLMWVCERDDDFLQVYNDKLLGRLNLNVLLIFDFKNANKILTDGV